MCQISIDDRSTANYSANSELIVILKSYFDAGNKADSSQFDVVSLAVVSATKDEWIPFEIAWRKMLKKHRLDYLHTTDAVAGQGIYKNLKAEEREYFLRDCVKIAAKYSARATIDSVPGKFGIFCFVVSIVLKDFIAEYKKNPLAGDNADQALFRQALGEVLLWSENQAACDTCHFFFDQGEPYYGHLRHLLDNKKAKEQAYLLNKVVQRSEANSRFFPPLQLADLYAWAQSRRNQKNQKTWQKKLLNTHFRWQWFDSKNVSDVNKAHQLAFRSWNLPKRAATK
jgi:hypothetical protein